jgi:cell division control protein 6
VAPTQPAEETKIFISLGDKLLSGSDNLANNVQGIGHQVIRMVLELEWHLIEDGNLLSPETAAGEPIGRQKESEQLRTCLAPVLRGQPPLNAWLCGPPGSGKTLLARWVVESTCGGATSRIGVYVNCWQHRSLYSVLQAVIDELKVLGAEAQDTNVKFDRIRQALRDRPAVIILDEIDRPMSARREEIICGLLNLPKVGLICIANSTQVLAAMDAHVRSQLSPVIIELPAYTPQEIEAILTDRARRALAPDSWTSAILRRIAAASGGDARRAINLLRQAAAATEQAGSSRLDLRLINPILKQWHALAEETKLTGVTEHERMILQVARTRGPLGTTALAQAYRTSCRVSGLPPVAHRTFSKYLSRMAALGLLHVADRPMAQGGRLVRVAKPGAD